MSARVPAALAALALAVKSYAAEHGQPGDRLFALVVIEEHEQPALAQKEACRALRVIAGYLRAESDELEASPPPLPLLTTRAILLLSLAGQLRSALDALAIERPETAEAPQPAA